MQFFSQKTAVGMGVGAHAPVSARCQFSEFRFQRAVFIEQIGWVITSQPILENFAVVRILPAIGHWHLMRSPMAFDDLAIHHLWPGPAFR
ncbi:hypothetical protein D3C80_1216830 [compost metagenome]